MLVVDGQSGLADSLPESELINVKRSTVPAADRLAHPANGRWRTHAQQILYAVQPTTRLDETTYKGIIRHLRRAQVLKFSDTPGHTS